MVNKERVRLLVEALRSGEYVQGRGYLEVAHPDGRVERCCLGVACRVAMANGVHVKLKQTTLTGGVVATIFDAQMGLPPVDVQSWYGFGAVDPPLRVSEEEAARVLDEPSEAARVTMSPSMKLDATILNDGWKLSFADIADAFERTYLDD